MSEATFKKKTQSKYNNNSVSQGHQGFSLNGTHRSQGWVGQELRSRTLVRTLNRAGANRGHGGCCGKYPRPFVIPSEIRSTENANVVKPSVLNTPGMMRERFAWIWRPAPQTSVKPDDNHGVGDQGSYLQYLNQTTISSIEQNCPYVLSKPKVSSNYPRRLFSNTNYNQPNVCPYENKSIPSNLGAVDSSSYLLDYKSGCSSVDAFNNFGVSRNSCAQCPIIASTVY
jgi:hypothetical protein